MKTLFSGKAEYIRISSIPPRVAGVMDAKLAYIKELGIRIKKKDGHKFVSKEDAEVLYEFYKNIEIPKGLTPRIITLTDRELVDELRRRGYEVKCTKTTIVEL